MCTDHLDSTESMGPLLRTEVEQQLREDLHAYGVRAGVLHINWSETAQEGHVTTLLDGDLESCSGVQVYDHYGQLVAEGWIEFIHGGDNNPLFVFWDTLVLYKGSQRRTVKSTSGIPSHLWARLPNASKQLCMTRTTYDATWCDDPHVVQWQKEHPNG